MNPLTSDKFVNNYTILICIDFLNYEVVSYNIDRSEYVITNKIQIPEGNFSLSAFDTDDRVLMIFCQTSKKSL